MTNIVTPGEKQCNTCNQIKPISDYYANKINKDGLCYRCKECEKCYSANYRRKKRESNDGRYFEVKREYDRKRYKKIGKKSPSPTDPKRVNYPPTASRWVGFEYYFLGFLGLGIGIPGFIFPMFF